MYFLIGVYLLYDVLLHNCVDQRWAHTYPLPLGPPSHPSRSSQTTVLSSLC